MARFITSPRSLVRGSRLSIRARKLRRPSLAPKAVAEVVPLVVEGRALNKPETLVYQALTELHINFQTQAQVFGGDVLGGARMDFYLPDYSVDIEYQGPFHATGPGTVHDALRNIGVKTLGVRVVTLYERDLPRLKPRILEVIGRPI